MNNVDMAELESNKILTDKLIRNIKNLKLSMVGAIGEWAEPNPKEKLTTWLARVSIKTLEMEKEQ